MSGIYFEACGSTETNRDVLQLLQRLPTLNHHQAGIPLDDIYDRCDQIADYLDALSEIDALQTLADPYEVLVQRVKILQENLDDLA